MTDSGRRRSRKLSYTKSTRVLIVATSLVLAMVIPALLFAAVGTSDSSEPTVVVSSLKAADSPDVATVPPTSGPRSPSAAPTDSLLEGAAGRSGSAALLHAAFPPMSGPPPPAAPTTSQEPAPTTAAPNTTTTLSSPSTTSAAPTTTSTTTLPDDATTTTTLSSPSTTSAAPTTTSTTTLPAGATTTTTLDPSGPTAEQWEALRQCESGGRYDAVGGGGRFRGAYQFKQSTWDWVAGWNNPALVGADPAAAAPPDQDSQAFALYGRRGASPWPTCGGLLL